MNGYGTNERSSKCLKWILPEILMGSFFFYYKVNIENS